MRTIALALAIAAVGCMPSRRPARLPQVEVELDDRFARVRSTMEELSMAGHEQARIHFNTTRASQVDGVVDLPPTRKANGVDELLIVRVRTTGTSVGEVQARSHVEILDAALRVRAGSEKVVALVRVDDRTLIRDVMAVISTLRQAGIKAIVLASTPADAPIVESEGFDPAGPCMFPDGATTIGESARVDVIRDAQGQPATVKIVEARSPAHAYAAAMCAARRVVTAEDNTFDPKIGRTSRFRDDTPVMKTPRDVRP